MTDIITDDEERSSDDEHLPSSGVGVCKVQTPGMLRGLLETFEPTTSAGSPYSEAQRTQVMETVCGCVDTHSWQYGLREQWKVIGKADIDKLRRELRSGAPTHLEDVFAPSGPSQLQRGVMLGLQHLQTEHSNATQQIFVVTPFEQCVIDCVLRKLRDPSDNSLYRRWANVIEEVLGGKGKDKFSATLTFSVAMREFAPTIFEGCARTCSSYAKFGPYLCCTMLPCTTPSCTTYSCTTPSSTTPPYTIPYCATDDLGAAVTGETDVGGKYMSWRSDKDKQQMMAWQLRHGILQFQNVALDVLETFLSKYDTEAFAWPVGIEGADEQFRQEKLAGYCKRKFPPLDVGDQTYNQPNCTPSTLAPLGMRKSPPIPLNTPAPTATLQLSEEDRRKKINLKATQAYEERLSQPSDNTQPVQKPQLKRPPPPPGPPPARGKPSTTASVPVDACSYGERCVVRDTDPLECSGCNDQNTHHACFVHNYPDEAEAARSGERVCAPCMTTALPRTDGT